MELRFITVVINEEYFLFEIGCIQFNQKLHNYILNCFVAFHFFINTYFFKFSYCYFKSSNFDYNYYNSKDFDISTYLICLFSFSSFCNISLKCLLSFYIISFKFLFFSYYNKISVYLTLFF